MTITTAAATAAASIAATESEAFIVGMIVGLRDALTRREAMCAEHYTGEQYVADVRAAYAAEIAVYVDALAIVRATR